MATEPTEDRLRLQLEQEIEQLWSIMCKTTDDVRLLTEKYGMKAIDGMENPTIDDMLAITKKLDNICSKVLEVLNGDAIKGYIDTRLLLNAKQMYIYFSKMIVAYKAENINDFLEARDHLKSQAHF